MSLYPVKVDFDKHLIGSETEDLKAMLRIAQIDVSIRKGLGPHTEESSYYVRMTRQDGEFVDFPVKAPYDAWREAACALLDKPPL